MTMEVNNELTLDTFDLSSTKAGEGTLVLGTSDTGGADWTLKVGDRSTGRGTPFSRNCGVGHLHWSFCGMVLVVFRRVRKLEMIQRLESFCHRGQRARQALALRRGPGACRRRDCWC